MDMRIETGVWNGTIVLKFSILINMTMNFTPHGQSNGVQMLLRLSLAKRCQDGP